MSLRNHKCMTHSTFINLHPNEYSQKLHYCQIVVKLDRFVGICNTLSELSNRFCVSIKQKI